VFGGDVQRRTACREHLHGRRRAKQRRDLPPGRPDLFEVVEQQQQRLVSQMLGQRLG
jgi:hypothetical protein